LEHTHVLILHELIAVHVLMFQFCTVPGIIEE
jgi:hypothetical protein